MSDAVFYPLGDTEIVDTPPDITLSCGGTVGPPSVAFSSIGVEVAKAVDKAGLDDGIETGALFFGKASVLPIRLWVGEIDFGMGDVEVAAKDNRFHCL